MKNKLLFAILFTLIFAFSHEKAFSMTNESGFKVSYSTANKPCKEKHSKKELYKFIIKDNGKIIYKNKFKNIPGCTTVISFLETIPYIAAEYREPMPLTLAEPLVDKIPIVGYQDVGVKISLVQDKENSSKINIKTEEISLMEMAAVSALEVPYVIKEYVYDAIVLNNSKYTKMSKNITFNDGTKIRHKLLFFIKKRTK